MWFLACVHTRFRRLTLKCLRWTRCRTDLISKLVTGKTQDHQPMGVPSLKLVELAEVPGRGASERGHILYKDHPSPEHVEVHRIPLQRGGLQVIESFGDERHLDSCASTLEADGVSVCASIQPFGHLMHSELPFTGVRLLYGKLI